MQQFEKGQHVHFVGIGGIGMSALAQLFIARGVAVSGSDREASKVTELLEGKGIRVYIGHAATHLPEALDSLVYSDAVPAENPERVLARERGVRELSYFEALGEVSKERFTIAVAGSHGKTTTTAMLGKILVDVGASPTVVVGSITKDFGSNVVLGGGEGPFVVEACEYNDHLLKLSPHILVVTNLEWDHTDYFKSFDQLKETFRKAVMKLPHDGALVVNLETPIGLELSLHAPCCVVNYADMTVPELQLLGEFNKMNAAAAKAAALAFMPAIEDTMINHSISSFQGTWRRFEYKGTTPSGGLVYDDYAHHPTEVATTIRAVREKFPDKKLVVAFHPHLFSRTRDLMEDFSQSFTGANEVILAPVYAARETPIEGVTSDVLAEKIKTYGINAVAVESFEEVIAEFEKHDSNSTLFITMGAGDIYKVADALTER